MFVGQFVAVKYIDNNLWYRGNILDCFNDKFRVLLVDYETVLDVNIERLRHLRMKFSILPLQAFRGGIYGIKYFPANKIGSMNSGKMLLQLNESK